MTTEEQRHTCKKRNIDEPKNEFKNDVLHLIWKIRNQYERKEKTKNIFSLYKVFKKGHQKALHLHNFLKENSNSFFQLRTFLSIVSNEFFLKDDSPLDNWPNLPDIFINLTESIELHNNLEKYLKDSKYWYQFLILLTEKFYSYSVQYFRTKLTNNFLSNSICQLDNLPTIDSDSPFIDLITEVNQLNVVGYDIDIGNLFGITVNKPKLTALCDLMKNILDYEIKASCKGDKARLRGKIINLNKTSSFSYKGCHQFLEIFALEKIYVPHDINFGTFKHVTIVAPVIEVIPEMISELLDAYTYTRYNKFTLHIDPYFVRTKKLVVPQGTILIISREIINKEALSFKKDDINDQVIEEAVNDYKFYIIESLEDAAWSERLRGFYKYLGNNPKIISKFNKVGWVDELKNLEVLFFRLSRKKVSKR